MHPATVEALANQRQREVKARAERLAADSVPAPVRRRVAAPLGEALVALGIRIARPRTIAMPVRSLPSAW